MRRNLITFGVAVIGMLAALGAYHIYIDHSIFHQIVSQLVAQQQQRQNAPSNSSGT